MYAKTVFNGIDDKSCIPSPLQMKLRGTNQQTNKRILNLKMKYCGNGNVKYALLSQYYFYNYYGSPNGSNSTDTRSEKVSPAYPNVSNIFGGLSGYCRNLNIQLAISQIVSSNINYGIHHDIEIISEPDTAINTSVKLFLGAKKKIDYCLDNRGLSFVMGCEQLWNAIVELKNKNIPARLVTEITTSNVRDCNLNMKHNEVFHSDRVRGNFFIIDGTEYLCYVMDESRLGGKLTIRQVLYTGLQPFVDCQQYLFDSLCSHSVPAREKIREIGRGINGDFIDVIRTSSEIQKVAMDLMESSTYEILLLFPTTNSFYRAEYSGMLDSVWKASQRGVAVKMLIQGTEEDNKLKEIVNRVIRQRNLPVNLQYISKPLETKISTLVIDQAVSLAIEVKDDERLNFEESTGIAIYSNSESKISSSLTIFETLWIQSEIDIQNKVKQAYFQMFKGFELKDELYTRPWSFEQQKSKKEK